jgi:hypothetical protein
MCRSRRAVAKAQHCLPTWTAARRDHREPDRSNEHASSFGTTEETTCIEIAVVAPIELMIACAPIAASHGTRSGNNNVATADDSWVPDPHW